MSHCIERIFTATGSDERDGPKSNRNNAIQSDVEGVTRNTATGSSAAKPEGGTRSTTAQSDFAEPVGDTGSIATDEPDCGVYVHVNMYV